MLSVYLLSFLIIYLNWINPVPVFQDQYDQTNPSIFITDRTFFLWDDWGVTCKSVSYNICLYDNKIERIDDARGQASSPDVFVYGAGSEEKMYVVWHSPKNGWDIFLRKRVGGVWSSSVLVSSGMGNCGDVGDQLYPSVSALNNIIFVAYQSSGNICVTRSNDDGQSFSLLSFSQIGFQPSLASDSNYLYIVYQDTSGNIYFSRTTDGSIFSSPKKIFTVSKEGETGLASISARNKNLYIVYVDKSTTNPSEYDIFFSISENSGDSWTVPESIPISGNEFRPDISISSQGVPYVVFQKKGEASFDIFYTSTQGVLRLSEGENNPYKLFPNGISASKEEKNIPALQIKIESENSIEDVVIKSLKLKTSGLGDDSKEVSKVSLYQDLDKNGLISIDDIKIADGVFDKDDGAVIFQGSITVPKNSSVYFLVTYSLSSKKDSTFQPSVESADILAIGKDTGFNQDIRGDKIMGVKIVVEEEITEGGASSQPILLLSIIEQQTKKFAPGQRDFQIVAFKVMNPSRENILLSGLSISVFGMRSVENVKLWADYDSDGVLTTSDKLLSLSSIQETLTSVSLTAGLVIQKGGSASFIISSDVTKTATEFYVVMTTASAQSVLTLTKPEVVGLPISSPIFSPGIIIELTAIPKSDIKTDSFEKVIMLILDVESLADDIRITKIKVKSEGTGDDSILPSLFVSQDVNLNEQFDEDRDIVLGSGIFTQDNGEATINTDFVVKENEPQRLIFFFSVKSYVNIYYYLILFSGFLLFIRKRAFLFSLFILLSLLLICARTPGRIVAVQKATGTYRLILTEVKAKGAKTLSEADVSGLPIEGRKLEIVVKE